MKCINCNKEINKFELVISHINPNKYSSVNNISYISNHIYNINDDIIKKKCYYDNSSYEYEIDQEYDELSYTENVKHLIFNYIGNVNNKIHNCNKSILYLFINSYQRVFHFENDYYSIEYDIKQKKAKYSTLLKDNGIADKYMEFYLDEDIVINDRNNKYKTLIDRTLEKVNRYDILK